MTNSIDHVRQLCQSKKYKPLNVDEYKGHYIVECETRAGITGATLDRRFDGTGYDVRQYGHDVERQVHFFWLVNVGQNGGATDE